MHVALAKAKCDTQTENGQSDPYVVLSFASATIYSELTEYI